MRTLKLTVAGLVLSAACGMAGTSQAEDTNAVQLPPPHMDAGKPLMQALKARQSQRSFAAAKPLPRPVLSSLLWAACGVNRSDTGKRTAPTAMNWQEIDVYVAMAEGLFLYDAKGNTLKRALSEDIRGLAGVQDFVHTAPAVLIFVADRARMEQAKDADKDFYSAVDTGYVSQNVYLFCASEGLATVVVGMVDRDALAKKMGLRPEQRVMLAQPVGYPGE